MNRNLLLFALFLVMLGVGFNFYLLSLFGILLLIPAFMAPSRPVPRPTSVPQSQEVRRVTPLPRTRPMAPGPQSPSPLEGGTMAPSAQPSSYTSYSPALFPSVLFPVSPLSGGQPPAPPSGGTPSGKDELVEAGAMLALLRLILG